MLEDALVLHKSVSNKFWQEVEFDQRVINTLTQKHDISEIVARFLACLGIETEQIEDYLFPTIKQSLPNPFHLIDIEKAAKRILLALERHEKVAIFGDYDVDGATSSALLSKYFSAINLDHKVYIPDRMKEGYGPNLSAILKLKEEGCKVLITVDCGTTANAILEKVSDENLDVIVIDHHLSNISLPKIFSLINPNRFDEKSEYKYLAAVGVVFLFVTAVNMLLKKGKENKILPNLLEYLDLVALGTVCDVVPLVGLNRTFVSQGLKVIKNRTNLGLSILSDVAKISGAHNTYHLGYLLGPRINAGGRVGDSELGYKILTSNSIDESIRIASELDILNNERKMIESLALEELMQIAEKMTNKRVLCIVKKNLHQGIIGIIAGRIKEKFNKPVAIITIDENGIGKASCRSVKGFDFGSAVSASKIENIVIDGGGHAMAAGFTIAEQNISKLNDFLEKKFLSSATDEIHINRYFAEINLESINLAICKEIEKIAPFGSENPEPRFLLKNVYIYEAKLFAGQHMKVLVGSSKIRSGSMSVLTAFKIIDTKIGQVLLEKNQKELGFVGYIRSSTWNGKEKADFVIDDILIL